MIRSKTGIVFCLAAIVVFATPLLVAAVIRPPEPEIRLLRTDDRISALIVTERERVLVINSDDRGLTRSAIGRFARPWEPPATTVLAPADDQAAVGLWEALRDPRIQQVIVVGLPGSDPLWSRIERECAQRGIALTYVTQRSHVELTSAELTVDPTDMTISVQHDRAVAAIALTSEPLTFAANVGVVNDVTTETLHLDLIVAPSFPETNVTPPVVMVNDRELVRLVFEADTVRVRGGHLTLDESDAN